LTETENQELDYLLGEYEEKMFDIATRYADYEGVCVCGDETDPHFRYTLHPDVMSLCLYALRKEDFDSFEILLLLNDIMISSELEDNEEEHTDSRIDELTEINMEHYRNNTDWKNPLHVEKLLKRNSKRGR